MKKPSQKLLSIALAGTLSISALSSITPSALAVNTAPAYPTGIYDIVLNESPTVTITDEAFEKPADISGIQLGSFFGNNSYNFGNNLSAAHKVIYNEMAAALASNTGVSSCSVTIDEAYRSDVISNISVIRDDVSIAFIALVMDHPEYVGLSHCNISVSTATPEVALVTFYYCDGQSAGDTAINSYNEVTAAVNSLVSSSSVYSSDYEKLKFFAEYICDNVTYNHSAANSGVGSNCWNAYGSLINGSCVCEGYAEAFKLLCDTASIPCILCTSYNHEWNMVYLDGAWYYTDVTWMDTEVTGKYNYEWFLTGTDNAAANDQKSSHVLSDSAVLMGYHSLIYPSVSSSEYIYVPGSSPDPDPTPDPVPDPSPVTDGLAFTGHYSDEGWISATGSGETSGNAANCHRLEAMTLSVSGYPYSGGITYRSHVQDIGWMDWVSDGAVSGTTGQCKKIEAFDVKLTGELANHYDVKYRVYVEGLGWTSWAKNGASAGTTGQNRKIFSVEMKIEP
ncbi:MAG: hypothetical protein J6A37_05660, partial [Oscillospiraceae bacterium]|nr:hypothetical protein [Oscillospiraceae bacterium]